MLRCEGLSLEYPGKSLIRNLDFEVHAGECWAILGKNGVGKSTLLHALGGLIPRAERHVVMQGKMLASYSRRTLAQNIGLLLQHEDRNYWGSVKEYVALGHYPHEQGLFWMLNPRVGVDEIEKMGLSELATRAINTLSGGEWQRARIALLLLQRPQLYLLDEPLQHLDLQHQQQTLNLFCDLARNEGKAVAMVLHDLTWLPRYCDHALLLYENAAPLAGPVAEVLTLENLERLFQCCLHSVVSEGGKVFLPG